MQGQNGWYYGYIVPANSPAFVELPTFFPAWGYGITVPAWAIDSPTPGGTNFFTSIFASGSQPNGLVTSGNKPQEQWTDRRWISDTAGTVDISGIIGDSAPFETSIQPTDQDGVIYEVLVDGSLVWTDGTNGFTANHPYSFDTSVNVGSVVDFITEPRVNDYADGNTFTATIQNVPEPASVELLASALVLLLVTLRLTRNHLRQS